MSWGSINCSFVAKRDVTEEEIVSFLKKKYEDADEIFVKEYGVANIDGRKIRLSFGDELNVEDFENLETECRAVVEEFADYSDGAVQIRTDYENDDGEKDESEYYAGPKRLILMAEIRDLEKKRDDIEERIAEKRQELRNAGVV